MPLLEFSLVALIALLFVFGGLLLIWLRYRSHFLKTLKTLSEEPALKKNNFKIIFNYKIFFSQQGTGDHMVLLHGIGASHYVWRLVTPELAKHYTVTAVDLLGFGLSDKPDTFKYDLDSQCEFIIEFLNELNIKKCILVGSSMGGTIALRLAEIRPDLFSKIITLSPAADHRIAFFDLTKISFLSPIVKPLITERFVKQIMKRVYSEKKLITDESIKTYTAPYASHIGAVDSFVKSFSLLRDPRVFQDLENITLPVLILWGVNDKIIPFRYASKIQNKIPNSVLEVHESAGHHVQEDDPEWVLLKIFNFLNH